MAYLSLKSLNSVWLKTKFVFEERYFSINWWGIWTAFLPRGEGIWTSQSSKVQMPGGGVGVESLIWLVHYAWLNFTCYHSPRATPGTSPALRSPGVGNCLKPSCPGGEVTSRLTPDRVFGVPGRILEFVADWLEKSNLSKLKSVFEGTFIIKC